MKNILFPCLFISALIISCSHGPYKATNKMYRTQVKQYAKMLAETPVKDSLGIINKDWIGTTNFNIRKPNFVILHHTAQNSCEQTLKTFTTVKSQVSAHYVICKDGTTHHMLNDYLRAWQAGISKWGNTTDINSSSIGIEIDNNGFEPFTEAQITSLLQLLGTLKKSYGIPTGNFIGHLDIAPGRKVDPNIRFPWKKLADQGFGLWYNDTTNVSVPPAFDYLQALRIVGYDIKDSSSAFGSFNLHFVQDSTKRLSDAGKKILYQLYRKYQ
ncbi:MAG: N-acetylmuramoyl-L-alanine amidase [Chitinophagaceae bacterium]|nr:N-acetylmuramoyl-L-alanine amidase [Chitinophagaceae bacterium]